MLLECNEDVKVRRRHDGRGAACKLVNSKWFKIVKAVIVKLVVCSGNLRDCWNANEKDRLQRAAGLVQDHVDKMASTLKGKPFMMYPLHAVLLNWS